MPLAQFSDLTKVIVRLCSKTLWDERIPNWEETLLCNCLIPFCSIQEKERGSEAQMLSLICDIQWWVWVTWSWIFQMVLLDAPIRPILHCFALKKKGWACRRLLFSPHSSLVCSFWSQCPKSILNRSGDCLRKQNLAPKRSLSLSRGHSVKICTPVFKHGKGQPSTIPLPFSIRSAYQKTMW